MKNLLLLVSIIFTQVVFGQEWVKNLPMDKVQKNEVTFDDVTKVFNDYYQPMAVVKGKSTVNGQSKKIPGWKQFKRWEWFWESRINPTTGKLPEGALADKIFNTAVKSRSKSSLGNWVSLGPSASDGGYAGLGRINCVAFHPTDNNTFWIGSPSGGLWKTTDGGNTWTVLTDNNTVLGVSDIAIPSDYDTSKTIYIATGDKDGGSIWSLGGGGNADNSSVGVLKSTDDGLTWQSTGLSYTISKKKLIGRLLIHPTDNNILFAATTDGIEKSSDGGNTWTNVYSFTPQYSSDMVIDMEFKPGSSTEIYASTKEYGKNPKILKSVDSGNTWAIINEFVATDYRVEIATTANDANYLYAVVSNQSSGLGGIYKSTDGGTTFVQLVNGSDPNKSYLYYYSDGSGENKGQGGYDLSIAASPTDKDLVLIGGINTWKTTDGGTTWNICNMWTSDKSYNLSGAPEIHADKHTLSFRADGTIFEGNDGGIYKSTNKGVAWTDLSNNLVISQIYRLGVSQTDSGMVLNGLQDNGCKLYGLGGWYDVTGGDGMECIIDYTNKNIQYASYTNGEIYRTKKLWSDQGATISDNIADTNGGAWVTPYIIDKTDPSTLYVGYADVWKTTDRGNTFTKISTMNTVNDIRSLAVAPSDSNVILAADFSHIWKTTDSGTTWNDITGTLPVTSDKITYLCIKQNDPSTFWVAMGGFDSNRIFESIDGGTTWTNISDGLPSIPVMCVVQNKLNTGENEIYAGTDVGVYLKLGTDYWVLYSSGLPNVVVTELDIYYDANTPKNSKLRAATYGRGLWESSLFSTGSTKLTADFAATPVNLTVGGVVSFTDHSLNGPTRWHWIFEGGSPDTSNVQNLTVRYDTIGDFDVTLTVTNATDTNTLIRSNYITVNPVIKPVAGFVADVTEGVYPLEVTFTNQSENATSYVWDFGDDQASTEVSPVHIYNQPGDYSVSLVASNDNYTDTIVKSNYITVGWPVPLADFDASPLTGADPLTVVFTDQSQNANTWLWDFGDGQFSVEQNPTHVFQKGIYDISLLVTNSSGNNSTIKEKLINSGYVDLPEKYKDILKVFPNPVSNWLTIELKNDHNKAVEFALYNASGKLIKSIISKTETNIKEQVDMRGLKAGNYLLRISWGNEVLVMNIVKE